MLVPKLRDERGDTVRWGCCEFIHALRREFRGKLSVVLVDPFEIGLQFLPPHERLVIAEEERDDALVQLVARNEDHAER